MKVITAERLRILESHFNSNGIYPAVSIRDLINECQELDTLTVTSLRPMSEAPRDEQILIKLKKSDGLMTVGKIDSHTPTIIWRSSHSYCVIDDSEGWIPMPRYEPEKV